MHYAVGKLDGPLRYRVWDEHLDGKLKNLVKLTREANGYLKTIAEAMPKLMSTGVLYGFTGDIDGVVSAGIVEFGSL